MKITMNELINVTGAMMDEAHKNSYGQSKSELYSEDGEIFEEIWFNEDLVLDIVANILENLGVKIETN